MDELLKYTIEKFNAGEIKQTILLELLMNDIEKLEKFPTNEQVKYLNEKYNIELSLNSFRSWHQRKKKKKKTTVEKVSEENRETKQKGKNPFEDLK